MTLLTPTQLDLVRLECPRCREIVIPTLVRKRRIFTENHFRLGAYCSSTLVNPTCGAFIKWVPQTTVWLALEKDQQTSGALPSPTPVSTALWHAAIINMARVCWEISENAGWHETPRSTLERAMLVVTECAELSEAARNGTLQDPSDHIPEHTQAAEEWADMLVRAFDHSREDGVTPSQLADAFIAKVEFNRSRPYRHGGKTV